MRKVNSLLLCILLFVLLFTFTGCKDKQVNKSESVSKQSEKQEPSISDIKNLEEIVNVYKDYFQTKMGIVLGDENSGLLSVENYSTYSELKKYLSNYVEDELLNKYYPSLEESKYFREIDGKLYAIKDIQIDRKAITYDIDNAKLLEVTDDNTYIVKLLEVSLDNSVTEVDFNFKGIADGFKLANIKLPSISDISNAKELLDFMNCMAFEGIVDCDWANSVSTDNVACESTYLVKNFNSIDEFRKYLRDNYLTENYLSRIDLYEWFTEDNGNLYYIVPVMGKETYVDGEKAYVATGIIGEKYEVVAPQMFADEPNPIGRVTMNIIVEDGVPKLDAEKWDRY